MLFVWLMAILFTVPWLILLMSVIDVRSGKKTSIRWKLPVTLLVFLSASAIAIQINLKHTYGFPFFQNSLETMIAAGIIIIVPLCMLVVNKLVSRTIGRNAPKSFHDPALINKLALSFAAAFFLLLFIGVPAGKKLGFAYAVDQAVERTAASDHKEFSIVLVSSERDCLSAKPHCRNSEYSNQFFIKNNLGKTQEVQVKIRALSQSGEEMKAVDSNIMTMEPDELRMIETDETGNSSSIWNRYSFKTEH